MGGKVYVDGLEKVIANLQNVTPILRSQLNDAIKLAADRTEAKAKEYAGYTDHSLKDLAEMGHPYKASDPEDSGPHPDQFVHIQSRNLINNIEKKIDIGSTNAKFSVGVDLAKVPYAKWLRDGSSKMRPRDFLGHAWKDVRNDVMGIINNAISRGTSRRGIVGRQ